MFGAFVEGWTRPIRAVLFDCFGTLVDCGDRQFVEVFQRICEESALTLAGKALWDTWLEHGRVLSRERGRDPSNPLAGPEPEFAPYREIWRLQFHRLFESLDGATCCRLSPADACRRMVEVLSQARCFPEVPAVLDSLRADLRLGVLSNADDDFLHGCLAGNALAFEVIVSSETAASYKPRAGIFRRACSALGLDPAEVLYAGDHPLADVLGAHTAGLPVVWVNRGGVKLPEGVPEPVAEVRDLGGLRRLFTVTGPAWTENAEPHLPARGEMPLRSLE